MRRETRDAPVMCTSPAHHGALTAEKCVLSPTPSLQSEVYSTASQALRHDTSHEQDLPSDAIPIEQRKLEVRRQLVVEKSHSCGA